MSKYEQCELKVEEYEDDVNPVMFYFTCKIGGVVCRGSRAHAHHSDAIKAGKEFIDGRNVADMFQEWLLGHEFRVKEAYPIFYWYAEFDDVTVTCKPMSTRAYAKAMGEKFLRTIYDLENNQKSRP
ncbi:MAG: hypothetical protein JKY25_06255 [Robiginitomaculum sp.]|nr:hypothetical protein [Robiginitomaculum sp.]